MTSPEDKPDTEALKRARAALDRCPYDQSWDYYAEVSNARSILDMLIADAKPMGLDVATALEMACTDIPPEFRRIVDREFWNLLQGVTVRPELQRTTQSDATYTEKKNDVIWFGAVSGSGAMPGSRRNGPIDRRFRKSAEGDPIRRMGPMERRRRNVDCPFALSATQQRTYDTMADAVSEVADAANEAFLKAGLEPGEWDGDDIVRDVKRGIAADIARLAARSTTGTMDPKTPEGHKQRHAELHRAFDELFADFIAHNPGLPGYTDQPILSLMKWSNQQQHNPTEVVGAASAIGTMPK